ncbi:DUF3822 family protein [Flavobacterium sp.]|uniref:DUF3822 family protein n=1 Tax=Flavobacterium sp. TaxID=239 RepID=UPI003D6B86B1
MSLANATILEKKYKNLVLQISLTDVSYCIKDTLDNRIILADNISIENISNPHQIEASLTKIFNETAALQTPFDEIIVLHNNNLLTFVPSVLFDENALSSYLQYNTKVFESDFFTYDVVSNYEMNTVYIPYVNINNFLIDYFGSFNYRHSFSVLVKKVLDCSKNIDEPQLFIHVQKDNFQIVAVKNQKLLLFNTFQYKTEQDFIYYILFTAEQLQLNPETVQVKLIGNIDNTSNLYKIAYKYIRNVSFFYDNYSLRDNLSKYEYLQHFTLIHSCE